MRAVVAAYVGAAAPVGSTTISHLLSVPLSSASIRTTMSELAELGLVEKPHSSAGRVPTEIGLRLFVDHLLQPQQIASEQSRQLRHSFGDTDVDGAMQVVSQFLSDSTRQLGFVMMPRLESVRLRHITLVRLSSERVLVLLVSQSGRTFQRVIEDSRGGQQADLDRMSAILGERVADRTLAEVREIMQAEADSLGRSAGSLLARAISLGQRALLIAGEEPVDLVVATRLALLDQPEFKDLSRLREIFSAMEDSDKLLHLMAGLLDGDGVHVALGDDLEAPGLRHCALVSAPYRAGSPLVQVGDLSADDAAPALGPSHGLVGVIGPSRMDYTRIIPLVHLCSQLVSEKFSENVKIETTEEPGA